MSGIFSATALIFFAYIGFDDIVNLAEETKKPKKNSVIARMFGDEKDEEISIDFQARGQFAPPPIDLLEKDSGKPGVGDIKANANIIKRTFDQAVLLQTVERLIG